MTLTYQNKLTGKIVIALRVAGTVPLKAGAVSKMVQVFIDEDDAAWTMPLDMFCEQHRPIKFRKEDGQVEAA